MSKGSGIVNLVTNGMVGGGGFSEENSALCISLADGRKCLNNAKQALQADALCI